MLWSKSFPSSRVGLTAYAKQAVDGAGFGTDYDYTSVSIKTSTEQAKSFEVLILEGSGSKLEPTVKWVDAQHLEITYTGNPRINLQVVRYAGITIDAHQVKVF